MGGPFFVMFGFVIFGVWIVMMALPIVRRPPPGCEPKICPACKVKNLSDANACKSCGEALPESAFPEDGGNDN
ncbi:MAG: hypothetical protein ACE5FZ_05055 [Nitrospiria bacterium]